MELLFIKIKPRHKGFYIKLDGRHRMLIQNFIKSATLQHISHDVVGNLRF